MAGTSTFDFSPFLTAPAVRDAIKPFGAPQIINIPETKIPSPLAPNLAPQTIRELKEFLTGCGPNGVIPDTSKHGVEIWETWKRAWDLWNNHYIEGRECPTWIKSEYERLKKIMDKVNEKKRRRRFRRARTPSSDCGDDRIGNKGQVVYRREFSKEKPGPGKDAKPGRMWVKHPFRVKKIKVPSGEKVRRNNPNPEVKVQMRSKWVTKLVDQKAGDKVDIYRKEPKFVDFDETRLVRENGPWKTLDTWKDLVNRRQSKVDWTPTETENSAEEMEPLSTKEEVVRVKRIDKHLDNVDIQQERIILIPLMSWKELAAARKAGGIPDSTARDAEGKYVNKRPKLWIANGYDLVPTGETEILTENRDRVEIREVEQYEEKTYGDAFEEVDVMKTISIPQWLEIDDPVYKKSQIVKNVPPIHNKLPPGWTIPTTTAAVTPPTDPHDFEVFGTKDSNKYNEWLSGLKTRWDAVNPGNLATIMNNDWLEYEKGMKNTVAAMWQHLDTPMTGVAPSKSPKKSPKKKTNPTGQFQSATHSNGHPIQTWQSPAHGTGHPAQTQTFQSPAHGNGHPALADFRFGPPAPVEEVSDEDMDDAVSDEEFEDAVAYEDYEDDGFEYEDEEMDEMDYEQRALGDADDDIYGDECDQDHGHDEDSQDNVNYTVGENSDSSSGNSKEDAHLNAGLAPPKRGPDGAAAGFLPLKLMSEYVEPAMNEDGSYPEWYDAFQNSVWRPRRVGEKTLRIDLDEPWVPETDLELDGGVDCGRSPYPCLRPVNKYIRNELVDNEGKSHITYRKEKVWDGVTSTIFNMPTRPDSPELETLDEHEARIKLLYGNISLEDPPRHDFFPLDIRRCWRINPLTGQPFGDEYIKPALPPNERETEFDFPWSNRLKEYSVMKETDPYWVTPEQEKLRDVPPRRWPQPDGARENDKCLPLDDSPWKKELLNEEDLKARYFATNLHGGTLIINGAEVKKGQIAGPLPDFAVIETEGGQVSFWWGLAGRDWGKGDDQMDWSSHWRMLRRIPGWEKLGLNAGQIWNKIIKGRIDREQSGNDEEDDDQWDEWKNAEQPGCGGNVNCGGGKAGSGESLVDDIHAPVEICFSSDIGPPCNMGQFKAPELFKTENLELEWLHTRAAPLRETVVGLVDASQQQVAQLRALSKLIEPMKEQGLWPGSKEQAHPEIDAQNAAKNTWPTKKRQVCKQQRALITRHEARKRAAEQAKRAAYNAVTMVNRKKRQIEHEERQEETKRTRTRLEQSIRDANSNLAKAQQQYKDGEEQKAKAEQRRNLVLDEATKLTYIAQAAKAKANNESKTFAPAEIEAAKQQRIADRQVELQQQAALLAQVNAARAARGDPAMAPPDPISDVEYRKVLDEAKEWLDPNHELNEKAKKEAARKANEDKIREAIKCRALRELTEREAARKTAEIEANKIKPKSKAEEDQEARRLRYEAAQARSDAQKQSEAEAKQKADELKRAKEETARRNQTNTAPAPIIPPRVVIPPNPTSPVIKQSVISPTIKLQPKTSPTIIIKQESGTSPIKASPTFTTPAAPTVPSQISQIKNQAEALLALETAQNLALNSLFLQAESVNQSIGGFLATKNQTQDEWLIDWKLDEITTEPFQKIPGKGPPQTQPDTGSRSGDQPPKGGFAPTGLIPRRTQRGDGVLSNIGVAQIRALRIGMRDAVLQAIQARCIEAGLNPDTEAYRIAWQDGFVDVKAMLNTWMNTITRDDIQDTVPNQDPTMQRDRWAEVNQRIYDQGRWDLVLTNLQQSGPRRIPQSNGGAEL
ncbi:uncharacterized protein PAC_13364 [Phialocephala subalpina]|uniref:Uncharacterized protein n=1 Tax=Phialocephala subalpina TaxID=576137 RepID=A0A1L7XEU0_9HELO|nr:uncharacterized protein PAC_13364 [Phialocephala subalpina]